MSFLRASTLVSLLTLLIGAGCTPPAENTASVDLGATRTKYVLSAEPAEPLTVLDLREQEGGFSEGQVVLVGQIGGMPSPWNEQDNEPAFPWREGEASFFLVDPSTVGEFGEHEHADGEPCPFCLKRAADSADSVAAVTFNGPDGKPLPVGAQQLFDLKENDMVVVKGVAKQLGGGLIVVNADGIYVRR